MQQECEFLTPKFAALIDLTSAELLGCLRFDLNSVLGRIDPDDVTRAKHFWHDVKTATDEQKKCDRIWSAGMHLLDVSAGLLHLDRKEEAEDFGEMGMDLQRIAEEVLVMDTQTISLRGGGEVEDEKRG